jgi:hypothetical protein
MSAGRHHVDISNYPSCDNRRSAFLLVKILNRLLLRLAEDRTKDKKRIIRNVQRFLQLCGKIFWKAESNEKQKPKLSEKLEAEKPDKQPNIRTNG